MAIEGPLKELGIHDVFQLLDLSRKTGVLTVASELRHNQGTVYFDDGAVIYAEIQSNPHPLGGMLVRAGKITEADLHRARDMQEHGDQRRLGEVLMDIGAVAERELERQVRFQVEEVIFEVMNWREGYFSFVEGPLREVPADATVRITTEAVLMEGARRIDEWSRIESKIPHVGVVPALAPADSGEGGGLDLLPFEWEVLATIDGERDLRTIASLVARSDFDVAKTIFGLESAGLVAVADRRAAPAPTEVPEDLRGLVERAESALEQGDLGAARQLAETMRERFPHEVAVDVVLGRVHLAAGEAGSAEEHLRRALRVDPLFGAAHRLLGDALALQGRLREAVEWWQRWLKIAEQEGRAEAEMQRVHDAVVAAQTLNTFLAGSRG
jgi:hypothetical protein